MRFTIDKRSSGEHCWHWIIFSICEWFCLSIINRLVSGLAVNHIDPVNYSMYYKFMLFFMNFIGYVELQLRSPINYPRVIELFFRLATADPTLGGSDISV
eukprot:jgi/Botrbrau1/820/Bobra.0352s0017.1